MRHASDTRHMVVRPDPCSFTLRSEGSSVPEGELDQFDAKSYRDQLRGHLYRAAREQFGGMPTGWLIAAMHGAYDPTTKTYPLHWHGLAGGGKIDVVDALRNLSMYHPAAPGDGRDAANQPVWMAREPLTNMPDPLSYILKSFWPLRPTYLDTDGRRKAIRIRVRRIQGPAHSEYLRFLDRWTVNQLTLIIGMHSSVRGLIVT